MLVEKAESLLPVVRDRHVLELADAKAEQDAALDPRNRAPRAVGFTPGRALRPEQSSQSSLRLSFPLLDEERLDEGVRRLAVAIRAVRRQSSAGWASALS